MTGFGIFYRLGLAVLKAAKEEHECGLKKFINVNIINFEKVDKPEGGGEEGANNVEKIILVKFGLF